MAPLAAVNGVCEFEFSENDFQRVRRLIHARAGIALNASKRNMVYSRLSRRLRERALPSFSAYLDSLEAGSCHDEWQRFVNALTTNLTAFFREAHHFEQLATLLARRGASRPALLWCAAASTGEEAYSMAITAMEASGSLEPPVRILATDIDTEVLEVGRRGVYAQQTLDKLAPALARRYFERGTGPNAGSVRVRAELRALVSFRHLNLREAAWPLRERYAAVFCRNVMIYFDKPTQRAILERLARRLEPGGVLFVGHSESLQWARDLFEPAGRTAYRAHPGAGGE